MLILGQKECRCHGDNRQETRPFDEQHGNLLHCKRRELNLRVCWTQGCNAVAKMQSSAEKMIVEKTCFDGDADVMGRIHSEKEKPSKTRVRLDGKTHDTYWLIDGQTIHVGSKLAFF